jgi:predicted peptidase
LLIDRGIPGGNIPCYWLHVPARHGASTTFPILVFLHGGGVGPDPDVDRLKDNGPLGYMLSDSELDPDTRDLIGRFLIVNPVLPEDPDNFTLWADNIDALDAIVDSVVSRHRGDPRRLYVTGNSRGGQGAWRFPKYSKHRVTAIVPVCGHFLDATNLMPLGDIPVWTLCNRGDRVHGVQMRAVEIIEGNGGEPFLLLEDARPEGDAYLERRHIATSFDREGHNAWTATYRSPHVYRWLMGRRGASRE